MHVAKEIATRAMPQQTTPTMVEPRFKGSPMNFQTTQETKPAIMPARIPGVVAFFQYRAARQGRPMAAA